MDRIDTLDESNRQLEDEKLALINQKNQILLQLCSHLQYCQVSPTPTAASVLKDTQLGTVLPCLQSSSSPRCTSSIDDTTTVAEPGKDLASSHSDGAGILTHNTTLDVHAQTIEENSSYPCLQNEGSVCNTSGQGSLGECASSVTFVKENTHIEKLNQNPFTKSSVKVHRVPFEEAKLSDGMGQKKHPKQNDGRIESPLDEERPSTSMTELLNPSGSSSDTCKPAGFECGVMFLQIADGKVQIQSADNPVIQVSPTGTVPVMGTAILRENTTSLDSVSCHDTPYDETSSSHNRQSFQSCGKNMTFACCKAPTLTGDETSVGEQTSLSSRAGKFIQPRDEKPSCSFQSTDQKVSTQKENKMVFYINQSRGLPFLFLTNSGSNIQSGHKEQSSSLEESGTLPEPHDQLNDISSAHNRCSSMVNMHGSHNQTTIKSIPSKTKSKRKLPKAHKAGASKAPVKKSKGVDNSNRLTPLSEFVEPTPLHFTVYKDSEFNQQMDGAAGAANNANENIHGNFGSPQTVKESFLRYQTNIRNNQFSHISPYSKQDGNGEDYRLLDVLKNISGSEDKDSSACTNENNGVLGNGCLGDNNTHPCTSTNEQTNTSTAPDQTSSASTVYTSEFRSFLTNCFESLNKKKVDETSPPTQGQLVLTSMELRFLSTNGQNQTDVQDNDHDHELVPNVDSVCLMNVLKETNRYYADRMNALDNDQECVDNSEALSCSLVLFSGLLLESENHTTQTERNNPTPFEGCLVLPENVLDSDMCSALPSSATASQLPSRIGAGEVTHGAERVIRENSPTLSQLFSDALPTVQSMTLSWSEHNQLVDTLLSGLTSSNDSK